MVMWWQLCVCSVGILLLAPCSLSEKFSLAGSPRPVVGVVGQDVVLPCQLSPPVRLPSMDVRWRKIESGFIPVHEYSDDGPQDLPGESYQTRTELFLQEFSSGNVSLKLKRLQVVDAGKYQCFVRNPEWSREATTELQVTAVAPVFIDVLGPLGQGIGLACRSAGWFPKPELQWVGKNWQNLSIEIVTNMTQDRENLYSVVSHVTVTEGEENGDISCIVRNGLPETERQSAIHLSVKRKASQKKHSKCETLINLETEKKSWESEYQELRETIEVERKTVETELHKKLEAERKAFEAECSKLCEKLEAERKAFEAECSKLRERIEFQEKEIKKLKSVSLMMERKSLKKLKEEVSKRKDIPKEEKKSLIEKIDDLAKEKDELLTEIGSGKMDTKSLKKLMEKVRESNDIHKEKKESLMEKISKLDKERDELRAQIASKNWNPEGKDNKKSGK